MNEIKHFPLSELCFCGQIGGFNAISGCTVFKGKDDDGHTIAIKQFNVLSNQYYKTYHARKPAFDTEIDLLRRCRHPNVIEMLGYCDVNLRDNEEKLLIVLEWAERGSVWFNVNAHDRLPWAHVLKILKGVGSALEHIHQHPNRAHRRLSPSNVVLMRDFTPKLIDFNQFERDETTYTREDQDQFFIAPEIVDRSGTTCPANVDRYSFALLTVFLLTHEGPDRQYKAGKNQGNGAFEDWLLQNKYVEEGKNCHSSTTTEEFQTVWHLLKRSVFAVDPNDRSAIGEVIDSLQALDR